MWIGWIELDLRLGDVHSLKTKRSIVRPIIAEVRRRYRVSVAETDHLDLYRRAGIGASVVAADRAHVVEMLDAIEQLIAYHPEVEVLAARRHMVTADD
jgi:uncharacterized protein